jgi:hypothetical protein
MFNGKKKEKEKRGLNSWLYYGEECARLKVPCQYVTTNNEIPHWT